jgi:primosomal protein N'
MQRLGGRHRFQLLLLATERAPLHQALRWVSREGRALAPPRTVRWSIDVDPLDCV